MKSDSFKVGLFDSGVGGATVLKELIKVLPNQDYIYYGDSANAPYGLNRSKEEIINLCVPIVEFLIKKGCKLIIIACNTASIATFDYLKEKFSVPILGIVESGAKAGIQATKNLNISVFSTKFTADSGIYEKLLIEQNPLVKVTQIPCLEFANMIEKGWDKIPDNDSILTKYIKMIPDESDTLILGCTHYPLIKYYIQKKIPKITIVNPAEKLSLQVKEVIEKHDIELLNKKNGSITFFTTGDINIFKNTIENFLEMEVNPLKV